MFPFFITLVKASFLWIKFMMMLHIDKKNIVKCLQLPIMTLILALQFILVDSLGLKEFSTLDILLPSLAHMSVRSFNIPPSPDLVFLFVMPNSFY